MGKWGPPKMGTRENGDPGFPFYREDGDPIGKMGTPIFWELKDPIQLYSSNQQLDDDKHRSGFSTSTTAKIAMYVVEGEPSLF